MIDTKDTILSLSGGLDSSSLLYEYKDRIALAVSFKYPSNHNTREIAAAKAVIKPLGIPHKVINVNKVFMGFKSALLAGSEAVPNAEYSQESISQLVVPFRNGIFLSILAGLADSMGLKYIALANHSNDTTTYPDCRPEFTKAINEAIKLGTGNNIEFFAPYVNISKTEVAVRGIKAGLNPYKTYSCYKGGQKHCGKCPTCIEREEAIAYAFAKLADSPRV